MGRCQYTLAKDAHKNFIVLTKNKPCGNGKVTCTDSVTVTVKGLTIHVRRGGQVTVFGASVRLPYKNKGKKHLSLINTTLHFSFVVGENTVSNSIKKTTSLIFSKDYEKSTNLKAIYKIQDYVQK